MYFLFSKAVSASILIYLVSSYLTDVNKPFELIELSDDDEEPEGNNQNATTASKPPDPKVHLQINVMDKTPSGTRGSNPDPNVNNQITVLDKTPNATRGSNPEPKVNHQNMVMVNNQNAPTGTHQATLLDVFETVWYYSDPQGQVQGPFSLQMLKRWNDALYFPQEFTIWRYLQNGALDVVLLVDALKRTLYPIGVCQIVPHPF